MISIPFTVGSFDGGKAPTIARDFWFSATLAPAMSSCSINCEALTTNFGPVELLITTRLSSRTSNTVPTSNGGPLDCALPVDERDLGDIQKSRCLSCRFRQKSLPISSPPHDI